MNEMISYCGLKCQSCPIYLATREENKEKQHQLRVEIAQQIKEIHGQEILPEDISDCDGCKAENGRLFSGSLNCYMRECARQKHIENCAFCDEYPCDELEKFFITYNEARKNLDAIKRSI
jgi:hypothetical protein